VRRVSRSSSCLAPLTVRPLISGSLYHQRWASSTAKSSTGTPTNQAATTEASPTGSQKKEEFVDIPFEWDMAYLKKFEIPPPTPAQFAKSIPAPQVDEVTGRAGQLASDLFEIAYTYDQLLNIAEELKELRKVAKAHPHITESIESKGTPKMETRKFFETLFQPASPLLKKFVARMVENSDFFRILQVADMFTELMMAHRNEMRVVLNVAKIPSSPEKLESLKARAALYHLPSGIVPVWEINEKPDLISGYTLITKEMSADVSQAGRDKKMKEKLTGIMKKISAAHVAPPVKVDIPPRVIKHGDELKVLADKVRKGEEANLKAKQQHYKDHFVDWA